PHGQSFIPHPSLKSFNAEFQRKLHRNKNSNRLDKANALYVCVESIQSRGGLRGEKTNVMNHQS
ncbi:MAG: hypothetical protein V3T82_08705, partial [Nitrospinaceae bacterium]